VYVVSFGFETRHILKKAHKEGRRSVGVSILTANVQRCMYDKGIAQYLRGSRIVLVLYCPAECTANCQYFCFKLQS
jgi:hypothetical protein